MKESMNHSETEQQTSTDKSTGNEEGHTLDDFRRILAGEDGESDEDGAAGESQQHAEPNKGEPDGDKPKGKPKALKDLAERLGLAPEDLYAIEVPMGGDGKSVTLGELKDVFAKQEDLSVRELELEERRAQQEAEFTRATQELQELLASLDPKAIRPEVMERVRSKIAADLHRERVETLRVIPEWQNEEVRERELAGMIEYLKDYGIPSSFLTATMSHKLFRFVRDAWQRKVRVEKALAGVATVKRPSTTGKSKPTGRAPKAPSVTPARRGRNTDLRSRFESVLRNER